MMVLLFKNLAQNIGSDEIISTEGALGEGLPKKVAVLLDFVELRGGGGPCPNFCPLFTNCIYWVNLGMGGRGRPLQKIFGTLAFNKSGTTCQNYLEPPTFFERQ